MSHPFFCPNESFQSQFLVAVAFGIVAVLYQIDTDSGRWEASEMASLFATREQLERFITNPDSVEKVSQDIQIRGHLAVKSTLFLTGNI